jgi:hypothetical protein
LRVQHVLDEVADAGCFVTDDELKSLGADQLHGLPLTRAAHCGQHSLRCQAASLERGGSGGRWAARPVEAQGKGMYIAAFYRSSLWACEDLLIQGEDKEA